MINIDVNSPIPVVETAYSHELNAKGGRKLEIAFYKDGVIFPVTTSANRTVTATLVCNGFLIAEDISTEPKSDNVVILDISSTDNYTIIPGTMLIELKVTGRNGEVVCPPSAMIVEVKPSIRDNAQITPESLGTVAEVIKEIATARGIYDNLGKRLDEFDEFIENEQNEKIVFKQGYDQQVKQFTSDIQNLHNIKIQIVDCPYETDLSECADLNKLYYFSSGLSTLNRNAIAEGVGAGVYIGFVKKVNNGWLFISSGEGQIKANYRILTSGELKLIGSSYDYSDLNNKPAINNVELTGNKTLSDLGLYTKEQVDEIIANQSVSGSGTLSINSSNGSSDVISSATYYYVKRGELVTLFCSIKFNAGNCSYVGFDRLPFNYNNKAGQLRTYSATSKAEMFRIAVNSGMLFISSSTTARTQDEELNFSITYLTDSASPLNLDVYSGGVVE